VIRQVDFTQHVRVERNWTEARSRYLDCHFALARAYLNQLEPRSDPA
jgi:hypothetical protein